MGVRSHFAAAAVAALVPLTWSAGATAFAGCPDDTAQPTSASGAQAAAALVCDINFIRVRRGLRPLGSSAALAGAAQSFAQDLAAQRQLSHVSSDGRSASDRIFGSGYFEGAASWLVLENVAWGNNALSTPLATALAWMQSDRHRANLLDPQAAEIGVGIAPGQIADASGFFYVADFAARGGRPAASRSAARPRSCSARKRRAAQRKRHIARRNRCRARTRV